VKITADANLLVRAIADDDPAQSPIARDILSQAEIGSACSSGAV
jgi:predicted nucleic acid-binding protein